MRIKAFLVPCILLVFSLFNCSKNYSTSSFSDPAWPKVTLSRIDYGWSQQSSMFPPSVAIFDDAVQEASHSYFIVSIGPFQSGAHGTLIHFGWSTEEVSLDHPLPADTFAFVGRFPLAGSTLKFSTKAPSDLECRDRIPEDNDVEGRIRLERVLTLGIDIANHFQMYPNYEQPFSKELRQQIQQLLQNLPFPERWKSNGC